MIPRQLTLLLVLLCAAAPTANAYANWLKCYVDLDDTEVIMNQQIKNYEDADHVVDLQMQRDSGSKDWITSDVSYPADTTSKWKVKILPPPELQGRNIQFVIETESTFNDGSKGEGAKFVYPKMCEGRRSFARNYKEAVELEIDGKADSIELWAAWATGFGQVSLTPRLVLLKGKAEDEEL